MVSRFSCFRIIARTMEEMDMQMPEPTVDLAKIRREYHQALRASKSGKSK
jgi:hypothetical protein